MSADKWSHCPICNNQDNKDWRKGVDHLYGKVPQKEYESAAKKYKECADIECVGEYYEVGINTDGLAYVNYNALCENCGARWTFNKPDIEHTQRAIP